MSKRILLVTLIVITFFSFNASATTVIGVIGKNKIYLLADTRLTITNKNGERTFDDNGNKLYKLKNGFGVAFVGDTNSIKSLKSGKPIITKSVSTIINDINSMVDLKDFNLGETTELIAEKYVNLLTDYSGDILIAGYEKDEPMIYGIRVVKGRAAWHGISGRGSFWAVGSGCNILMNKIKINLDCEENISSKKLGMEHLALLKDKELEALMKKSLREVIEEYRDSYRIEEQTTGGEVDLLIIQK